MFTRKLVSCSFGRRVLGRYQYPRTSEKGTVFCIFPQMHKVTTFVRQPSVKSGIPLRVRYIIQKPECKLRLAIYSRNREKGGTIESSYGPWQFLTRVCGRRQSLEGTCVELRKLTMLDRRDCLASHSLDAIGDTPSTKKRPFVNANNNRRLTYILGLFRSVISHLVFAVQTREQQAIQ